MMKILCSLTVFILLAGWMCCYAQESLESQHQALLKKVGFSRLSNSNTQIMKENESSFSVIASGNETSLFTTCGEKSYHIYALRSETGNVTFWINTVGGNGSSLYVTIEKSQYQFGIKVDPARTSQNICVETILPLACRFMEYNYSQEQWWKGFLTFSPEEYESRAYYATRAEAVANVPTHVSPKDCFVWKDGSASLPWRPIPGTGCAHWVGHQKGMSGSPGCYDGYPIRVSQVTSGKTQYSIANARVGDIWTNTDGSHCGIVIATGNGQVQVRHCSSGSGGVVTSWFSSGYAWR